MAFADLGAFVNSTVHVSSTTWAFSPTVQLNAGEIGILIFATDNNGTTDGDLNDIANISDTKFNTWIKLGEFTNGQGTAASGATCSIWYTKPPANLLTSDTITMTLAGAARTGKAVTGERFSVGAGNILSVIGTTATLAQDAGTDFGALTVGSLASSEHLWVRGCAEESIDTVDLTVTATWGQFVGATDTGSGTSTSDMGARGEFKIATATTNTSDPTNTFAAADLASILVALDEVAPPAALDLPSIHPSSTFKDQRIRM